jgi:hypothetical protein
MLRKLNPTQVRLGRIDFMVQDDSVFAVYGELPCYQQPIRSNVVDVVDGQHIESEGDDDVHILQL